MAANNRSKGFQDLIDRYVPPERMDAFEALCADYKIGAKLNTLRSDAGLSIAELAKKAGTSPKMISRIIYAEFDQIPLPTLRRVAAVLEHKLEVRFVPVEVEKRDES